MKNICLLGATGSIGSQVLDLIIEFDKKYNLVCFSFGDNVDKAIEIIEAFKPLFVSCKNKEDKEKLEKKYPDISFDYGIIGLKKVATFECADPLVINALVGSVGLIPSYECLNMNRDLYLANKESLVIGGEILTKIAKENNCRIIPIDSEHSAIYQLLNDKNKKDVKRLLITASGGAFRDYSKEELKNVTIADALKHPNWKMGKKITIDCATMMNKGFELLEAYWLFNVPKENIVPILHRESIVHSMVEFNDGSIFAQLASSDMHLPIKYALEEEHTYSSNIKPLDIENIGQLHFEKMNYEKYPLLELCIDALNKGGLYPTILNACNEFAVNCFINNEFDYLTMIKIIEEGYKYKGFYSLHLNDLTIDYIIEVDKYVKNVLHETFTK